MPTAALNPKALIELNCLKKGREVEWGFYQQQRLVWTKNWFWIMNGNFLVGNIHKHSHCQQKKMAKGGSTHDDFIIHACRWQLYNESLTFTVIRNPKDTAVSFYYHIKKLVSCYHLLVITFCSQYNCTTCATIIMSMLKYVPHGQR